MLECLIALLITGNGFLGSGRTVVCNDSNSEVGFRPKHVKTRDEQTKVHLVRSYFFNWLCLAVRPGKPELKLFQLPGEHPSSGGFDDHVLMIRIFLCIPLPIIVLPKAKTVRDHFWPFMCTGCFSVLINTYKVVY